MIGKRHEGRRRHDAQPRDAQQCAPTHWRRLRAQVTSLGRWLLLVSTLCYALGARPAQAGAGGATLLPATASLPGTFPPALPAATHTYPAAALPARRPVAHSLPPLPPLPAPLPAVPLPLHRVVPAIVRLRSVAGSQQATLTVQLGWNLITLPLAPTSPINASAVLTALLGATHGTLAALYGLTRGTWSPSLIDHGGQLLGADFALSLGQGYLLYSDTQGSFALSGVTPDAPTWSLSTGWDLIGLPQGATTPVSATTVLRSVLAVSHGQLAALFALSRNAWTPSLIAASGGTIGRDFTLQAGMGYLAYADSAAPTVEVPGFLPPDPSTLAPALDTSVASNVFSATTFLYTGPDAIQMGVPAGTIVITRAAELRGRVLDNAGAPLPGVTVAILNHPEYGQTLSRADGMYDLVVDGGGLLTVTYAKQGYISSQRQIQVRAQDWTHVDDVALLQYDPSVSAVDLAAGTVQVAQGSVENDASGTRQMAVLFPPGTTANMVLPDGSTQPLPSALHVRVTEFTVGSYGSAAMPAALPPTSGYTYALDFSVDEARAAGATSVTFSQPVYASVQNFLDFNVGVHVPNGNLDTSTGLWVAAHDGLVIARLPDQNGQVQLDIDGSGTAASAASLAALGIGPQELPEIATLYQPGQSFEWLPLTHFSAYDPNLNVGPSPGAAPPKQAPPPPKCDCNKEKKGSILYVQNQAVGEDVPVTGAPFYLHYQSDRTAAHPASTLRIALSGPTLPPGVLQIDLQVDAGGEYVTQAFSPTINLAYLYHWNSQDLFGQTMQGPQPVTVRIGYEYQAEYLAPSVNPLNTDPKYDEEFGHFTYYGIPASTNPARTRITLWEEYQTELSAAGSWDARGEGLGGWSASIHNSYDPLGHVLYMGDGTQRSVQSLPATATIVAGGGIGDGGPALSAPPLAQPYGLALGSDGSIYVAENSAGGRVRRIAPDGTISTVAGNGETGYSGDGGAATDARLQGPSGVAVGPDGSLYVADSRNSVIRRISPTGIISTVVGSPQYCPGPTQPCGDGGPATQAELNDPIGVSIGPDGSLYIADAVDNRIRKVAPNGTITTVAGTGSPCASPAATPACGDGGPATVAQLTDPTSVAVAPNGTLYIGDAGDFRVREVTGGTISTVAGSGQACNDPTTPCGDGGPATAASFGFRTAADELTVARGAGGTLYIGDASAYRVRQVSSTGTISTLAGTGVVCSGIVGQAHCGDGGPAAQAQTDPEGVAVTAGGTVYIADAIGRVRAVNAAGTISSIAGDGSTLIIGDGGPATGASLSTPDSIAVAPNGTLYIADPGAGASSCVVCGLPGPRHRTQAHPWRSVAAASTVQDFLRMVSPAGIINPVIPNCSTGPTRCAIDVMAVAPDGSLYIASTGGIHAEEVFHLAADGTLTLVAGGGNGTEDGVPATQYSLSSVSGMTVAPDGTLYLVNGFCNCVWRVDTDGIITTVAGTGAAGYSGDGGPAEQATLNQPSSLAVAPDGSLYILDYGNSVIRRVGIDGIISTVAGGGSQPIQPGLPATQVALTLFPGQFSVGPDGSLYLPASQGVVQVRPDGTVAVVAGSSGIATAPDGLGNDGPATNADIGVVATAVGPDGSLYVSGQTSNLTYVIWRVAPAIQGNLLGDYLVPSADASQIFDFDNSGRQLRTLDALTGVTLYSFGYDAAGRLRTITDRAGNVTTIQHDANGNPTAIVDPYRQTTTLSVDANGNLASVADPAGDTTRVTYNRLGQALTFADPNGNTNHFGYDSTNLLVSDQEPNGGGTTLARSDATGIYTVTATTALGRATSYAVVDQADGSQIRTDTDPAGLRTVTTIGADSGFTSTAPDGTVTTYAPAPDPRFGMLGTANGTLTVRAPSGNTMTISTVSGVQLNQNDPINPGTLASETTTTTVNGNAYTESYLAATRTITDTTPAGRVMVTTLDSLGRVSQVQVPGLTPVQYSYDGRGRLSTVVQGTRTTTYTYDAHGNLASVQDPLGHVTGYQYDAADRVTQETLPDGSQIGFGYDADGNLSSLTPPGQPAHTFTYDTLGDVSGYNPPALGSGATPTTYSYNQDGQITAINQPGGSTISLSYDGAGRLTGFSMPRGQTGYTYDAHSGNLAGITAPDGGTIGFGYDGFLLTGSAGADGALAGSLGYSYDALFRLAGETLNGGSAVSFGYDGDSLLTGAGALSLSYDPGNGLLTGTTLGSVSDSYSYSGFGELNGYQATSGVTPLLGESYTRDALGRISQRSETIGGATHTYAYSYDVDGRLTGVSIDGHAATSYTYDANGNRLSATGVTGTTGTVQGNYNAQDQLTQYGGAGYSYDANGDLASRTSGGQTTQYTYDALGTLTGVVLPDGTHISYLIDGEGRRIGKKVNGTLQQGFVYDEANLGPVAQTDGSGHVTAQFIYATDPSVPAYMVEGGVTYRIITDWLGSPRLVVNAATGAIVERIDYDEFGNMLADTNPGFQPFGFAGGLYDAQTGLVRFGARDYDPAVGRWTTKDPIGFGGGDSDLFGYVANDPINYSDNLGLGDIGQVVAAAWNATQAIAPQAWNGLQNAGPDTALDAYPWSVPGWESIGQQAVEYAKKHGSPPYTPGVHNALRHTYWQAKLTIRYGACKAKAIADAHEDIAESRKAGGDKWADTIADLHNNEVGRNIGQQLKDSGLSGADLEAALDRAIQEGLRSGTLDTSSPLW